MSATRGTAAAAATIGVLAADAALLIDRGEVGRGLRADLAPAAAVRQLQPAQVVAEAAARGAEERRVGGVVRCVDAEGDVVARGPVIIRW